MPRLERSLDRSRKSFWIRLFSIALGHVFHLLNLTAISKYTGLRITWACLEMARHWFSGSTCPITKHTPASDDLMRAIIATSSELSASSLLVRHHGGSLDLRVDCCYRKQQCVQPLPSCTPNADQNLRLATNPQLLRTVLCDQTALQPSDHPSNTLLSLSLIG